MSSTTAPRVMYGDLCQGSERGNRRSAEVRNQEHPQRRRAGGYRRPAPPARNRRVFSSCIPPFAAVTLTLEDGALSTAWRRPMATGFLSLFYLTFLPVVFFPRQPVDAEEPQNYATGFVVVDDAEHAFSCTMISLWEGARA